MVKNNIEMDVKMKCLESGGVSQQQIGETIGTTGQYVNRVIKKGEVINKTFVQIMEALGYDIEMTYVKRGE